MKQTHSILTPQGNAETFSLLEGVSLFSGLSPEAMRIIESRGRRRRYRKNTVVLEKGDETTSLYVLLSGKVKVFVLDEEGRELVLSVLEPGAHLGELALLGEMARTASVMTREDSEFLVISKTDFVACLADNPEISMAVIRDLVARVQSLTQRVTMLVLSDVYGRVAAVLQERAREEAGRLITDRLTQQDIAQMVGASREMVSRIFKELRQGGYIDIEDKRVVLNKPLPRRW